MLFANKKLHTHVVDFSWSFKPIVIWARFVLGIELNKSSKHGLCRTATVSSIGFFMLTFNTIFNVLAIVFMFDVIMNGHASPYKSEYLLLQNLTRSCLLIVEVTALNDATYNIIIYLVFFFVATTNEWKKLWCTLQEIHFDKPKDTKEFFFHVRKIAIVGTTCILMVYL